MILFVLITAISFISYFAYTYSPKKKLLQHENPDFYNKLKFKIEKACFEVRLPGDLAAEGNRNGEDEASVYDRVQ